MRYRKLLPYLLALCLLSSLWSVGASAAWSDTPLRVEAQRSSDGATLTVAVAIEASEKLCSLQFTLDYDSSQLVYRSGAKLLPPFHVMLHAINPNKAGTLLVAAADADGVENPGGAVMTLVFAINNAAAEISDPTLGEIRLSDSAGNKWQGTADTVTEAPPPPPTIRPIAPTEVTVTLFSDISGHFAEDYIKQAEKLCLMEGLGGGIFAPDDAMTRAQFVTILWRSHGSPKPTKNAEFTDLDPTKSWYLDAVAWAEKTGAVNGVGNGKFAPDAPVSREQMVTVLFRLSGGSSGMEAMLTTTYENAFEDCGEISDWARPAVFWSIYREIICGTDKSTPEKTLSPTDHATRAQIAVSIIRYMSKQNEAG